MVEQSYVTQGGRDLAGVIVLERLAVVHRPTGIEEDVDRKVGFLLEEAQNELVQPEKGSPIDVLGVFTRHILSIIREFDSGVGLLLGPVLTMEMSRNHVIRDDVQVLELLQKLLVEESPGLSHGEDPTPCPAASKERTRSTSGPRYSVDSGVSFMIALRIASVSMRSASPSKFSRTRWRRAGSSMARTSSHDTWTLPFSSALTLPPMTSV